MKNIYTITTIQNMKYNRLVGWFEDLDDAKTVVLGNYGDIYETCYTYAVISKKPLGIYQPSLESIWYIWKNGRYFPCTVPNEYKMVDMSGIG